MRITKALLHKYAQEEIKQRKQTEPDLHAAYLTGSLIKAEPLLGGTTDIDLVCVHKYQASVKRETKAITKEISLDVFHYTKDDYAQYHQLRQSSIMGYPLTNYNIILFDTDHWLEFIQSTVNADFHRSENVLARVNHFLSAARKKWFLINQSSFNTQDEWLNTYLDILSNAANAITGLIAPPLTERRFLLEFQTLSNSLGVEKIYAGFRGLLGLFDDLEFHHTEWLSAFEEDYDKLQVEPDPPAHLNPCRKNYYTNALRALIDNPMPELALWPLIRTWLDVRLAIPGAQDLNEDAWLEFLNTLHLTGEHMPQRGDAIDAYLDNVEETIDLWQKTYGN
jgi:hypothetical protein